MVKCEINQASKSIFDRTLFIRVSFRTCVCVWYGERKGEKTKDMSGRVGSVAGTSSDMSFGADQTVVVSVRPSVVSCRVVGRQGDRGAGRDITTRQYRDEERDEERGSTRPPPPPPITLTLTPNPASSIDS